jgi:hypothetical protein
MLFGNAAPARPITLQNRDRVAGGRLEKSHDGKFQRPEESSRDT